MGKRVFLAQPKDSRRSAAPVVVPHFDTNKTTTWK